MTERFVISKNKNEIQVLDVGHDLGEEQGNLLVFGIDFEDNEELVDYLAYELSDMVRLLNGMDKELQKQGIVF